MSLKVAVVTKGKDEAKKAKYPRLMLHTPTQSIVLQYTDRDAIKLINGTDSPAWSKTTGPNWLMTSVENYVSWPGKVTLEND